MTTETAPAPRISRFVMRHIVRLDHGFVVGQESGQRHGRKRFEMTVFCCPCDREAWGRVSQRNLSGPRAWADTSNPYVWELDWTAGTLTVDDQRWEAPPDRAAEWARCLWNSLAGVRAARRLSPDEIRERAVDILGFRGRSRLTPEEQSRLRQWIRRNQRFCDIVRAMEIVDAAPPSPGELVDCQFAASMREAVTQLSRIEA